MVEAQKLVDTSGTLGDPVTFGATGFVLQRDYLVTVLEDLGYEVSIDKRDPFVSGFQQDPRAQINIGGWGSDYLAPSTFLGLFTCNDEQTLINYCDTAFDAAFDHALELQALDPPAALSAWTELDHRAVDLALMAPMYNGGSYFVSDQVGNYQFNPAYSVLFDQMWVR